MAGIIYGYSFYKREKITPIRVVLTLLCVTVFVNLCMTTTWISFQASVKSIGAIFTDPAETARNFRISFLGLLPARATKNFIMLPINSMLVYLLLNLVRKLKLERLIRA